MTYTPRNTDTKVKDTHIDTEQKADEVKHTDEKTQQSEGCRRCMCPPDVEWWTHEDKSHIRRRRGGLKGNQQP